MNKRIIGNFLKKMEISVMGKKMKLKLDEIKVESFVTSSNSNSIKGGLLPTDPDACGTNTCQNYTKVGCNTTPEQCAGYTQIGCGGTVDVLSKADVVSDTVALKSLVKHLPVIQRILSITRVDH